MSAGSPRIGFDLVIFDCDGVLVDSEPIANRVFAEELASIGLAMSHADVCETFIGLSMQHSIEIVEDRLGRPVPADFLENLRRRTLEAFEQGDLRAVDGVVEALDAIDVPVCVASSGSVDKMRWTLGRTGLLPRFEGRLFSSSMVERGKPFPDLFLHAARTLGAHPERCAVIEDSLPGVQAAVAAGMTVYAYVAHSDGVRLRTAGARTFGDMRDLASRLRNG